MFISFSLKYKYKYNDKQSNNEWKNNEFTKEWKLNSHSYLPNFECPKKKKNTKAETKIFGKRVKEREKGSKTKKR